MVVNIQGVWAIWYVLLFLLRSTGFILEGFPRTEAEARYLSSSGLFPDIAVILVVEDTEIVDRLLPPLLEKWRKKRDKREAEKERQRALAKKQKVGFAVAFYFLVLYDTF